MNIGEFRELIMSFNARMNPNYYKLLVQRESGQISSYDIYKECVKFVVMNSYTAVNSRNDGFRFSYLFFIFEGFDEINGHPVAFFRTYNNKDLPARSILYYDNGFKTYTPQLDGNINVMDGTHYIIKDDLDIDTIPVLTVKDIYDDIIGTLGW